MHRHPYWYDQVKRDQLSGGDLISNFHDQPGEAVYRFTAPSAGEYELWVRANPVQAKLSYRLNDGPLDADRRRQGARVNQHRRRRQARPAVPRLGEGRQGLVEEGSQRDPVPDGQSPTTTTATSTASSSPTSRSLPRGTVKPDQLAAASRRVGRGEQGLVRLRPEARPVLRVERHRPAVTEREDGRRRRLHRRQGLAVRPLQDRRARPVLGGQRAVEQGTATTCARRPGCWPSTA